MLDRFTSLLDCVDTGHLPDTILDTLPHPEHLGRTRVGGIDLNTARARAAIAAATALAIAPDGLGLSWERCNWPNGRPACLPERVSDDRQDTEHEFHSLVSY